MREYIVALGSSSREDAWHRLIEVGPEVIPVLTHHFDSEQSADIRAILVNVAWRTSPAGSLVLLRKALSDHDESVWKEALDGLVTLGGSAALLVLEKERKISTSNKLAWIDESIKQVEWDSNTNRRT